MINKENIPKGTQIDFTEKINLKELYGIEAAYGHSVQWLFAAPNIDTANFIADAFNVFNKTGMTPEELSERLIFSKADRSLIEVDLKDLEKSGFEYAKKWIEELREEKYYWAEECNRLKEQIEQLKQERDELKIKIKAFERAFEGLKIAKDVIEAVKIISESLNTQQEESK